jgi:uncharacterized protein (DUF1778 family)
MAKKSKRRGGRPTLTPAQRKQGRIAIRVTLEERAKIEKAAAAERRTLTDFARIAILERAGL